MWWVVSENGSPHEGERIHTSVAGRYITIFRYKGKLSSIDSICHHAGGPLTLGNITDIEDLGVSVVSCPW
jgi:nitrite reductase/ring-hydroxylating ferredoxin subunit